LIIYQTAPDIKVTRRVLYYFRNWIPNNININNLLKSFDDELERFSDNNIEEIDLSKIEEPKKKKKRKKEEILTQTAVQVFKQDEVTEKEMALPTERKLEDGWGQWQRESENLVPAEINEAVNTTMKDLENKEIYFENFIKKVKDYEETEKQTYRFGKTTPAIAEKLILFVQKCIDEPGPFIVDPEIAASEIKLSKRAKEVFLDRLQSLKLGDKQLITKDKYGNCSANYKASEILEYALDIIEG